MNVAIRRHSQLLISGLVLLAAYLPALLWMWDRWFARDSYYTHGILVPFVTGYLIWQQREELSRIPVKRSAWGMVLIVGGILFYLLSSLFRVYFSSGFSLLIVLVGLVLHYYGTAVFRKILFPLFFLVFMMPLPLVVIINISFKMKLFAAEIAASILNGMGVWAHQEGSIIKMRHTYVIVDDVCSGLRSLITLTALGSIFAYWLKGPMYKRILLFLATIPIAIVTNVCRVIILSLMSEIWGAEYTAGFVHDATGMLVFVLAFILLYITARILE